MPIDTTNNHVIFEVEDIFEKKIRTTKEYWQKIITEKHSELKFDTPDVIKTLKNPDEVYKSVRDSYIKLFYKQYAEVDLVVLVKYLNGNGFVVTVYQTTKTKRKGEKLWPK